MNGTSQYHHYQITLFGELKGGGGSQAPDWMDECLYQSQVPTIIKKKKNKTKQNKNKTNKHKQTQNKQTNKQNKTTKTLFVKALFNKI